MFEPEGIYVAMLTPFSADGTINEPELRRMVDFLHFKDTAERAGGAIRMLTGREETLLPSLMMGGRGCMTAGAGILPEVLVEIYRAWSAAELDRAKGLQVDLLAVIRAMFALPFPLGFKAAMQLRGIDMGPPKQPLGRIEAQQVADGTAAISKALGTLLKKQQLPLEVTDHR